MGKDLGLKHTHIYTHTVPFPSFFQYYNFGLP